jgi:glycosyltransferase involved in cell wall biosynthesis
MRILVVADWFLKVAEGQAAALSEHGDDVVLLCRDHALEYGNAAHEREAALRSLRDAGVRILQLSGRRHHPEGTRSVARAMRTVRKWRPDVASVHQNEDARLLLLSRHLPLALTIHDPVPHPGHPPPRWIERATSAAWVKSAGCIVVHGDHLIADVTPEMRARGIRVIPHGIRVAAQAFPPPQEAAVLLFGRLEPYKGLEVLLAATRLVWDTHPSLRLIIAGRGDEARCIPGHPNIEVLDRYIGEAEIDELFARASVCALPYTQASQSGVGLQAIARGVPVVVSRIGALPELAHHDALVVPPSDPAALARALERALAMGPVERERVHEFAKQRFSWPVVAQQYRDVYEELVT